jgi:hypothetical protein
MNIRTLALVVTSCGVVCTLARAEEITLKEVQPAVVKTVPEAGIADVDPKLNEVQVTFSKEMREDLRHLDQQPEVRQLQGRAGPPGRAFSVGVQDQELMAW